MWSAESFTGAAKRAQQPFRGAPDGVARAGPWNVPPPPAECTVLSEACLENEATWCIWEQGSDLVLMCAHNVVAKY